MPTQPNPKITRYLVLSQMNYSQMKKNAKRSICLNFPKWQLYPGPVIRTTPGSATFLDSKPRGNTNGHSWSHCQRWSGVNLTFHICFTLCLLKNSTAVCWPVSSGVDLTNQGIIPSGHGTQFYPMKIQKRLLEVSGGCMQSNPDPASALVTLSEFYLQMEKCK